MGRKALAIQADAASPEKLAKLLTAASEMASKGNKAGAFAKFKEVLALDPRSALEATAKYLDFARGKLDDRDDLAVAEKAVDAVLDRLRRAVADDVAADLTDLLNATRRIAAWIARGARSSGGATARRSTCRAR